MKTDVLVTGAGPVGLTMAAELARYGVSVRVIDKAARRTDKSKALVIWSRTLELIDRMGCGGSFLQAGYKVSTIAIVAGNKQIAQVTLAGVATPHPYALMIPQSETERLMEEHLSSCGIPVERSVELTHFADQGDTVSSTLRHADGREETIETSWLIGCDGAHSTVRHGLGMEFLGDTLTSDWILADIHLSGMPAVGEVGVAWHSDGALAIFPMSHDRYRVIADVGDAHGDKLRSDPTLEEVQAILDRRGPGGIQASAPIWLSAFRINERKVANYRSGRVFVAGDAAHVHSPAGGQGMNTGMQDACNLAWKLALVCRGVCTEPLLDSYSVERSAVGDQVLKAAGRMTAIGTMRGELKQYLRNHIGSLVFGLSPVRKAMADVLTEVTIGYPDSPLTASHGHASAAPAPGERAPIRKHEPSVGSGNTPRFALFAEPSQTSSEILGRYSELLDPNLQEPFHAGGIWLVRPDGYVSLAAKSDNWNQVAVFLDQFATAQRIRQQSSTG